MSKWADFVVSGI